MDTLISLEGEERKGYKVSSSMKAVWNVQINLVKKLLEVCKNNNLKIWADGGTLLGTIREHGYIPWDDDIDMVMLRDDYDKLVAISQKEFRSPFFFQSAHSENNYFRGHSQLRYENTAAILPGDLFQRFNQGIFIDIFVYDEIPDDFDEEWYISLKKADLIMSRLLGSTYPGYYVFSPKINLYHLKCRRYCRRKGYLTLFDEFESLFRINNGKGYKRVSCPCFSRQLFDIATRELTWYDGTIWLPFETIKLPVPSGYDMILRTQYGNNFMTPMQAPSIHGGYLILDANNSYKKYLFRQRLCFIWKKIFSKLKNKNWVG